MDRLTSTILDEDHIIPCKLAARSYLSSTMSSASSALDSLISSSQNKIRPFRLVVSFQGVTLFGPHHQTGLDNNASKQEVSLDQVNHERQRRLGQDIVEVSATQTTQVGSDQDDAPKLAYEAHQMNRDQIHDHETQEQAAKSVSETNENDIIIKEMVYAACRRDATELDLVRALEETRRRLMEEKEEGLLRNVMPSVICEVPPSVRSQNERRSVAVAPSVEETNTTTSNTRKNKTAKDFFKSAKNEVVVPDTTTTSKQTNDVVKSSSSSGIKSFFGNANPTPSIVVDADDDDDENEQTQATKPTSTTTTTTTPKKTSKFFVADDDEAVDQVKEEEKGEETSKTTDHDNNEEEFLSSSDDEALERFAKSRKKRSSPTKSSKATTKSNKSGKEKKMSPTKRSKVVDSESEEDNDKELTPEEIAARAEKKLAKERKQQERQAQRAAEKAAAEEEERRVRLEREKEAKEEFIRSLGPSYSGDQNHRKKKKMVRKSYVDADGFTVEQDVLEEVDEEEVRLPESTPPAPAPPPPPRPKPTTASTFPKTSKQSAKKSVNADITKFFKPVAKKSS